MEGIIIRISDFIEVFTRISENEMRMKLIIIVPLYKEIRSSKIKYYSFK